MSFNLNLSFLFIVLLLAPPAGAATNTPDDATVKTEVTAAQALQDARKFPEARAAFEKILQHAPDEPTANCQVALYACDKGEWEKALSCASKALAADANNARYQYVWGAANGVAALKGGVFSKLGHAKKCLAAYQRASELEPRNVQYHWALLSYYQQAPGFVGGSIDLAYAQAAEIKKLDPRSGRQAFAQLYLSEKKYDLAFGQYEEVPAEERDDYQTSYSFGRLTLLSGQRLDEGLAAFQRCLELAPPSDGEKRVRADVHWRLGNVWERKGQVETARTEYLTALKELPDFRPAKQALEKLGDRKS